MSEETKTDAAEKPVDEKPKTGADYVKEAFDCFLKDKPKDMEPLGVIRSFYEANASDELKAKCAAEGKTIEGAYEFMQRVARKAGGNSISDSVGLSICMHYFQDVPAMADFEPKLKKEEEAKRRAEAKKIAEEAAAKKKAREDKSKSAKNGKLQADDNKKKPDAKVEKKPDAKDEKMAVSEEPEKSAETKPQQYQEVCFDLGV